MTEEILESEPIPEFDVPPEDAGFVKFYGVFWAKSSIDVEKKELLGFPKGWGKRGKSAGPFNRMNFWNQKGIYILYDASMNPVYAGQVGVAKKKGSDGRCLGDRLGDHLNSHFRNAWHFFSWFGFLDTDKANLGKVSKAGPYSPTWTPPAKNSESSFANLLNSFEAIVIEGFSPRFNAKGGNLGKAVFVDELSRD